MTDALAVQMPGLWVVFTYHAAERWKDHRRPLVDLELAVEQLATQVAQHGTISRRRPHGVELMGMRQKLTTVAWLLLAEEAVVFPLVRSDRGKRLIAITCIARRSK